MAPAKVRYATAGLLQVVESVSRRGRGRAIGWRCRACDPDIKRVFVDGHRAASREQLLADWQEHEQSEAHRQEVRARAAIRHAQQQLRRR